MKCQTLIEKRMIAIENIGREEILGSKDR